LLFWAVSANGERARARQRMDFRSFPEIRISANVIMNPPHAPAKAKRGRRLEALRQERPHYIPSERRWDSSEFAADEKDLTKKLRAS
jgi:hypothetical protein